MKRNRIIYGLIVIVIMLAFSFNIPIEVETVTISSSEINESDHKTRELMRDMRNTIHENSESVVFYGDVYILRAHYLLGDNKSVFSVPYIVADIRDVSTSGTTQWQFRPRILAVNWRGDTQISSSETLIESSKFIVDADPNTSLNSHGNYDDHLEAELNKKILGTTNSYILDIGAATKNSSEMPSAECTAFIKWNGNLNISCGAFNSKVIPFQIAGSAKYINNVKGVHSPVF